MEIVTIALLALIAGETSYLAYKSVPRNKIERHSLLIDTSVLIDGRILSIARSGLITAPMIIPRSVIRELQYMADKADHDKRERAREGLDMIEQLKQIEGVTITVIDDKSSETGVDERLIELANEYKARLCTIDYNLNKAARAQNVSVVNINELAHALRIIHLPGEIVQLKLVQTGQESRQAVGYLDDGTMVVVDDAKALIGHEIEAEVTRVLQTAAGKMMFARKTKSSEQTRGTGEDRSRMFDSKTQTPGETEGGGQMFARKSGQTRGEGHMIAEKQTRGEGRMLREPMQTLGDDSGHSAIKTSSSSRVSGNSRANTTEKNLQVGATTDQGRTKEVETSLPSASQLTEQTSPNRKYSPKSQRRNNRRRSPEDALVDLANE